MIFRALKKINRLLRLDKGQPEANLLFTRDFPKYKKYDIGYGTYGEPYILDFKDGSALKIGKYCSMAGVTILLGGEHPTDRPSTYPFESISLKVIDESTDIVSDRFTKGDVTIGNDVWIGHNSMILSGVNIGDGAIIGACAVIAKNVPPYAIVIGNPAKIIKYRFTTEIIDQLLRIAWWKWDDAIIKSRLSDFQLPIVQFVSKYAIKK